MIKPKNVKIAEALGDQPRDAYMKGFNSPETRERIRQRVRELWCSSPEGHWWIRVDIEYDWVVLKLMVRDKEKMRISSHTESIAWEEALLWLTEKAR